MTNPSIASDLIERLVRRASIRRQIPGRKSVQEGAPDRIADLLEEASSALSQLTREVDELREALHKIADDPYRYGIRVQKMKLIASEALSRSSGGWVMRPNKGVPASPSGLRPFGVEPAAQSQAEPLVPNACEVPPEGWWCSREAGHDGPCAAREITPPWYAKLIAELRAPPYWQADYGPGDARLDIAPRHASDALEITVAALQAVKRVALACEGASYDLILSYADNALRARPSCGFWVAASGIEAPSGVESVFPDSTEGESPTAESGDAQ